MNANFERVGVSKHGGWQAFRKEALRAAKSIEWKFYEI